MIRFVTIIGLGMLLGPLAQASNTGNGYVVVTGDQSYMEATWSVGTMPRAGDESSWITINRLGPSFYIYAYDATSGNRFSCYQTSSVSTQWSYQLREIGQFRDGATMSVSRDVNSGRCAGISIRMRPGT